MLLPDQWIGGHGVQRLEIAGLDRSQANQLVL
jgi:hypothetical protein